MYILLTFIIAIVSFVIGKTSTQIGIIDAYKEGYNKAWDDVVYISNSVKLGKTKEEALIELIERDHAKENIS